MIADGQCLRERRITIRQKEPVARLLDGFKDKLLTPELMKTSVSARRSDRTLPCPDQPGIGYFF
ncbi:MAG TPA: hypothetical protein VF226_13225 [Hyphomicrobiaceae bacterium]